MHTPVFHIVKCPTKENVAFNFPLEYNIYLDEKAENSLLSDFEYLRSVPCLLQTRNVPTLCRENVQNVIVLLGSFMGY